MYNIAKYRLMLVRDGAIAAPSQAGTPKSVAEILAAYLSGADREHLVVLLLDAKNAVIGINTVSIGSLGESIVHPREVFKPAIVGNAKSIVVGHNHPSGDPAPSREDRQITHQLAAAGKILGIPLVDHVIIGDDHKYFSFHEAAEI